MHNSGIHGGCSAWWVARRCGVAGRWKRERDEQAVRLAGVGDERDDAVDRRKGGVDRPRVAVIFESVLAALGGLGVAELLGAAVGGVEVALLDVLAELAERGPGLGAAGLELDGFLEIGERFVVAALHRVGLAACEVGVGVIGAAAEQLGERGDRGGVALPELEEAEVEARRVVHRSGGQRAFGAAPRAVRPYPLLP